SARWAAAGAVSRKSRLVTVSPKRSTAKPPPPRLPASGWTTARARAVATAASAALPPAARISRPAAVAAASSEEAAPPLPRTGGKDAAPATAGMRQLTPAASTAAAKTGCRRIMVWSVLARRPAVWRRGGSSEFAQGGADRLDRASAVVEEEHRV